MKKETIIIPDLGGVDEVTVLEIFVSVGDTIVFDQALMSLESDKASMDVPSDRSGVIQEILLKTGDVVREGDACVVVSVVGEAQANAETAMSAEKSASDQQDINQAGQARTAVTQVGQVSASIDNNIHVSSHSTDEIQANQAESVDDTRQDQTNIASRHIQNPVSVAPQVQRLDQALTAGAASEYASPSVRKLARKFGIDIGAIPGTGRSGRVTIDDIVKTVQARTAQVKQPTTSSERWVDPSQFGPCEEKAFNKIKKATAAAMTRSWSHVVHVTQFDKVDITDLEDYRGQHKDTLKAQSIRLTMLAFIMKGLVAVLRQHPNLNASYQNETQQLWLKRYYHFGVAVDTPLGLVVPVIKNVDQLSIIDIAQELGRISQRARDGKLLPKDLAGASFTISSLGGIGGEYFTPIVNSPQTAILGVSRAQMTPVWDGSAFQPRLMLPLSLSYDHRIIDGAEAMRFLNDYMQTLGALVNQDLASAE